MTRLTVPLCGGQVVGKSHMRSVQPAGESPVVLAYTPAGRLCDQVSPNGAATSQDFDPAGWVARIRHTQSGADVSVLDYAFDANSNRTQESQSRPSGSRSTSYSYNRDDRLIGTDTLAEGGRQTQTVNTLDGVGNRMTEILTDAGTAIRGQPQRSPMLTPRRGVS